MRHPAGLPAALRAVDRTLVVGVLNVTPDSFSDGGLYLEPADAVAHGLALVAAGADLVDVGGESTRPGAAAVPIEQELDRVVPVVRELAADGARVSVDTRHAAVARACVEAGAMLVNDVSGGTADPLMLPFLAGAEVPYVLMHNRGGGPARDDLADYVDAVSEVVTELRTGLADAVAAGVAAERIVLDPGLGFAKRPQHCWALLEPDGLTALGSLGRPLLIGASRKRFLGVGSDGAPDAGDTMEQRDALTVRITDRVARAGAWAVRVHDVAPNAAAVRTAAAAARMVP